MTAPPDSRRFAIIGAGAAGLSAARHLMEAGLDVRVFEAGSFVGGLWVYENDNGRSAAYESLHINSEPRVTHFRDLPFPENTGMFPSHRQVADYLASVADDCGLTPYINFNSEVIEINPTRRGALNEWIVTLKGGASLTFDGVVVCSGHQGVPLHPTWRHDFGGHYMHSNEYRSAEQFREQRVLVVGAGNSGLDIAADLALVASETHLAARSPVLIMPRMMFGVPTARVLAKVTRPYFPWRLQRQILRSVSRIFSGPMEKWGFVTPKTRTHPASSATFMTHVAYESIQIHKGVASISGRTIRFDDDTSTEVDVVIAATGYEVCLPFLSSATSPVAKSRIATYKRIVHPDWPGLYFIGFFNVSGGANISLMDVQSQWLASVVQKRVTLPSSAEMKADIAREHDYYAGRYPPSARYGLELEPARYKKALGASRQRGRK